MSGITLSFFGAAQEVTGACYLLETPSAKILVDCGLFQCPGVCEEKNFEPFRFSPSEIDAVFVTHAHIDHTGRLPKLVKDGFRGVIYSTPATKELARLMLEDSLGLMEREKKHEARELLFAKEDLDRTFEFWKDLEYHEKLPIKDAAVRLLDAGHILGSSMVRIETGGEVIVLTGDLGNPPTPLLRPTEAVTDATYLVIESTYGNKAHEDRENRRLKIERIIEDTVKKGGVLMIPAFSMERTQELLFEMDRLVEEGRIPQIPVFVDSPLAIRATEVYRNYERYYNQEAHHILKSGDEVFKFPRLKFTPTAEESKAVIAGSGMSTGGRILHHEKRYLSDPNSALLLIGYQAAGSRGRQLQDGAKSVRIFGETVPVRARVETIQGYSAHPDRDGLVEFVQRSADTLKKVFAVQGEPASALFLVQRLRDYLGIDARAPRYGESFELK
ncbi:MAG: MBL fold metallo-hydrolase [Candidatus Niyogibacteria bacterium]|nr:MBL fold metallo-hydrolase [Candidatus Niyogibacteria bacterium]